MSKNQRWVISYLSFIIFHLSISTASAQTQLSEYRPGVTTEGAIYYLPKTAIRLKVQVEKARYQPGDFALYAQRFLRLNDVSMEPKTTYRVVSVTAESVGVPDTSKVFAVRFNTKTVATNMALSEEGLLLAINADPHTQELSPAFKPAKKPAKVNPRQFMSEDILAAGSTAKMAELSAREIYDLRENRSLLIKGQADFMPNDGAQMQLMLSQIEQQDRALTEMFQGTTECDTTEHVITVIPTAPVIRGVAFRLSQFAGLVPEDDLSGVPYYINIEDISNLPSIDEEAAAKAKKKQVQSGIYVNVPGKMQVSIYKDNQRLYSSQMPAPQFGRVELLSGELFDKHYTTRLWLSPISGAVERLEAELPKK